MAIRTDSGKFTHTESHFDEANPLFSHKRVLIVSSHSLFGQGLKLLLLNRPEADVQVVGIVPSIDEAMLILKQKEVNLVVVDHDDDAVNRDEVIARFVEGDQSLRVVLLSLKEGGSDAIVFDRQTMEASQINSWLSSETITKPTEAKVPDREDFHPADKSNRRSDMKHGFRAAILIVVLFTFGLIFLRTDRLLPKEASVQAKPIDFVSCILL
jgi:hypothetical protein